MNSKPIVPRTIKTPKTENIGDLAKKFRDAVDAAKAFEVDYKLKKAKLDAWVEEFENAFLAYLTTNKIDNIKTQYGTIYKSPFVSAKVSNRDVFIEYIVKQDRFDMLDVRVNKTAATEFLEKTKKMPPGTEVVKIDKVHLRRS